MAIDFKKYFLFTGRATRSEFWLFTAARVIVYSFVIYAFLGVGRELNSLPDDHTFADRMVLLSNERWLLDLCNFAVLALIIPSYSLASCRLHDRSFSAWPLWLVFLTFLFLVYNPVILLLLSVVAPDLVASLAGSIFELFSDTSSGLNWTPVFSFFMYPIAFLGIICFLFTFVQSLLPSRADNKYGPNPHQ